jgi:hypothetical protein
VDERAVEDLIAMRDVLALSLRDVVRLVQASEEAMGAIRYSRSNGGKYQSVERMFEKIDAYEAVRSRVLQPASTGVDDTEEPPLTD